MSSGFVTGEEELKKAAIEYYKSLYALSNNDIKENIAIHQDLPWRPTFYFKNRHTITAIEISEHPFPMVFKLQALNIINFNKLLIKVICVCPSSNIITGSARNEKKELLKQGFGLITIGEDGDIESHDEGIPLRQFISEAEFNTEVKSLPKKIRQRLRDSYTAYNASPSNGLSEITEIIESVINELTKQLIRKGWLVTSDNNLTLSGKIDKMLACSQCTNAKASIGGVKHYVSFYRNLAHHAPNTPKKAYDKAHKAQHGFKEGIILLKHLKEQMKNYGINIKVT